ncbi:MAG TPA: energy transducer TonB [Thermoanaerobaculia bacterium]|nr:energy transducer TonB [Thermoanaerobaculia bacterium]
MVTHWKFGRHALAIALISIAGLGTASASTLPAETWRKAVNENALNLKKGDYTASLAAADHVLSEMVKYLGAGSAEDEMLATVLTQKALAQAGQGNISEALWYWYIAQEISPAAAKSDLSAFGAPGEYLKRHPFAIADPNPGPGTTPAHVVKQVVPNFPSGASHFGAGDLIVHIIIDKNGTATLPHIVHPLPAPTLSYVALEALRRWQFAPAKQNGQAVSFPFNLTVHYKL